MMFSRIRAPADFLAGLLFVGIGLGFAYASTRYQLGTAVEMGPGYFPFGLGILLSAVGAIIAISAVLPSTVTQGLPSINFKVVVFVLGPVILFALLLDKLGFVLSLLMVVIGSSLASRELKWYTALASALVLTAISVLVFVYLLKVQVHLWPAFWS